MIYILLVWYKNDRKGKILFLLRLNQNRRFIKFSHCFLRFLTILQCLRRETTMEKFLISNTPQPERRLRAERRRHARFYVRNRPVAFVHLQFGIVGHIKNISLRGLSFLYFASRDRSKKLFTVNILSSDCSVFLDHVPITTVWDNPRNEHISVECVPVRNCGMLFRGLTDRQETDLEYFIENCTKDVGAL